MLFCFVVGEASAVVALQQPESLADLARKAREQKKSVQPSEDGSTQAPIKKVLTNDEIESRSAGTAAENGSGSVTGNVVLCGALRSARDAQ